MPVRLTRWICRRSRLVIAIWLLVLVVGLFFAGGRLFPRLDSTGPGTASGTPSQLAADRLAQVDPQGEQIYAVADGRSVRDPALVASVRRVAARLRSLPGVATVEAPSGPGGAGLVARDGRALALVVTFRSALSGDAAAAAAARASSELHTIAAPRVVVGGGPLLDQAFNRQSQSDLAHGELLALPTILLLLIVLFGGFTAAALPVLGAVCAIAGTLLTLLAVSYLMTVSVYTINVVTMLGLGLAVDYGLLVVGRFREERALVGDVPSAIQRALATSGRTVLFSGLTVAAALSGLLVFDDRALRSMAVGGAVVVVIDVLAATTLLPALLARFGGRVRPRRAAGGRGAVAAIAGVVQRRALPIALLTATGLAVLALPFLGVRYANQDARSLPPGSPDHVLYTMATTRFAAGTGIDPITVLADTGRSRALAAYARMLATLPGARSVRQGAQRSATTVLEVVPTGAADGPAAMRLVSVLRAQRQPFAIQVTGPAAQLADYEHAIGTRLPWCLAIIVLATFVLLFAFTGSLVVPLKALAMNVLSLGATFGALVWVFQDGHLAHLFGVAPTGALDPITPVLVFAIAFGLSMDYEVFLLSRIKESYDRFGDNTAAVTSGLERTARIITSAALLISVVFLGFLTGGLLTIKEIGLGLALAVLIDATVVRLLLVPATMQLLGRANWWAPAVLRNAHNRFGLREGTYVPGEQPTPVPFA